MAMTLQTLVLELMQNGVLRTPTIIDAFLQIDRRDFVLPEYADEAYQDIVLPIGYGQTISQPTTVAFMLELLQPQPGDRILDVGAGSGWATALLAHLVGGKGQVTGMEIIPELAVFGEKNLTKLGFIHAHARIHEATATVGYPEHAPYDRILVSAESASIPPELVEQLRIGGVIVLPVQSALVKGTKKQDGSLDVERYEGFAFVPLVR